MVTVYFSAEEYGNETKKRLKYDGTSALLFFLLEPQAKRDPPQTQRGDIAPHTSGNEDLDAVNINLKREQIKLKSAGYRRAQKFKNKIKKRIKF